MVRSVRGWGRLWASHFRPRPTALACSFASKHLGHIFCAIEGPAFVCQVGPPTPARPRVLTTRRFLSCCFCFFARYSGSPGPARRPPTELFAPEVQEQPHKLFLVHVPGKLLDVLAHHGQLIRHAVELQQARLLKGKGHLSRSGWCSRLARPHKAHRSGPAASGPRRLGGQRHPVSPLSRGTPGPAPSS